LTPIHTKLGLMKNCGKTMGKRRSKYPNISEAKIKRGAFVRPKLGKVTFDENFEVKLNPTELAVLKFFNSLACDFHCEKN
jgi:uncharacterized pyridoxamine 5'-phosphate oxidase family protein